MTVGVYVQNVQAVDLNTNSFSADFYVWLRWRNPDIDAPAGIEVQNVFENWALSKTDVYPEPRKQPDGSMVWLGRYQGEFQLSAVGVGLPFRTKPCASFSGRDQQCRAGGLRAGQGSDHRQPVHHPRRLQLRRAAHRVRQPHLSNVVRRYRIRPPRPTYSRVVVEIPVTSPITSGIFKTILPLLIVLIAAALGVIIPASYVDSKVNVPITALIALVAMQFGVSSALPEVGYLPMIDLIYVLAYAAITGMLGSAVIGAWRLRQTGEDAAMTLERRFTLWICICIRAVLHRGHPVLRADPPGCCRRTAFAFRLRSDRVRCGPAYGPSSRRPRGRPALAKPSPVRCAWAPAEPVRETNPVCGPAPLR